MPLTYIMTFIIFFCLTLQIVAIVLTIALFVAALYDVIYSRSPGGDPTMALDASSPGSATTFNNPGFKEPRSATIWQPCHGWRQ